MMFAIRDCLSNLACSEDEMDGDDNEGDDPELRSLRDDDEPS